MEEELEKRKDEIELEVARRVEAAKVQMEREMMIELEKRRETAREEERKREVNIFFTQFYYSVIRFAFRSAVRCLLPFKFTTTKKNNIFFNFV